jgi:hypothetical protein
MTPRVSMFGQPPEHDHIRMVMSSKRVYHVTLEGLRAKR